MVFLPILSEIFSVMKSDKLAIFIMKRFNLSYKYPNMTISTAKMLQINYFAIAIKPELNSRTSRRLALTQPPSYVTGHISYRLTICKLPHNPEQILEINTNTNRPRSKCIQINYTICKSAAHILQNDKRFPLLFDLLSKQPASTTAVSCTINNCKAFRASNI